MSFWNKIEDPGSDPSPRSPTAPATEPPTVRAELAAPSAPVAPPSPSPSRDASAAHPDSLRLGRGVRFEGKLTFSGTVRIDATFQGSIVTDGVLVVGEHATVDADITCGTVVVEGRVHGNVVAREAVELRSSATLRGDVESPALVVERGARFEGVSRRPAGTASASAGKAAAAPAPSAH